jgi:NAD(P)-dependent dehydrogenase (short-subunit alcohol dehydrogenase family)
MPSTWIIVGASRGIGLEFVRQLLARGDQVIAAVRNQKTAGELWKLAASQTRPASCIIEQCDVTKESDIDVCLVHVNISGWSGNWGVTAPC